MPPRIPGSSCQPQRLLTRLEQAPTWSLAPSAALAPRHRPTAHSSPSSPSTSPSPRCSRPFSTTPARHETKLRRQFKEFINGVGGAFFRNPPEEGGPRYTTALQNDTERMAPFRHNPNFISQPVLSPRARNWIWYQVMVRGQPLKAVSATHHVDMRRVAAVVRLMEIEKRWERENKPMATPYARAINRILPRADLVEGEKPFEPINDIHVHSYTTQQLFVPASESRRFTRADAAKAFGEHILPPDDKMRIPELVQMEKDLARGVEPRRAHAAFVQAAGDSERALADRLRAREQAAEDRRVRVHTGRFELRFEKINAEDIGPTGRARKAVGWRYGAPLMDRRRGEVKIPTSVGE